VTVMADGRGDRAFLQSKTLNQAIGMIAVLAVPLDDGDLDDIAV
jgi:hypothetical protein